jgi:hypothetical protein
MVLHDHQQPRHAPKLPADSHAVQRHRLPPGLQAVVRGLLQACLDGAVSAAGRRHVQVRLAACFGSFSAA